MFLFDKLIRYFDFDDIMWKEFIEGLTDDCKFTAPVEVSQFATVENSLGCKLPKEIKSVLLESTGIWGEYGLGLVWSLDAIKKQNIEFRTTPDFAEIYMPFDHLLFFADAGNGDQFAFRVLAGAVRYPDVFVWNHENDSRMWVASSLQKYLEWWLNGTLQV